MELRRVPFVATVGIPLGVQIMATEITFDAQK
jgi:hypothetical protein